MLKKAALVLLVLVIAFLGFAATRPDEFRVQRTARIDAPPDKIYASLDDFHRWPAWSPWEKLDPDMRRTLRGPTRGEGAVYEWEGNSEVGKGRMEIMEASAPGRVTIKLDFLEPFEAHNTAQFTLKPSGKSTDVTWSMYGPSPFVSKVMGMIFNMDRMIGKDFEQGLANLKAVAES